MSNATCTGDYGVAQMQLAWSRALDSLTAILEPSDGFVGASDPAAEQACRRLSLHVLHMRLDDADQRIAVRSPLLRRLQLNAQAQYVVGAEAVASRLL